MGGKMIKNIIILSLILVIVTGMSGSEFLDHVAIALDKMQEVVYTVQSEVN